MKKVLLVGMMGLLAAGAATTVSAESKSSTVSIEFVANDAIENLARASEDNQITTLQMPHDNMIVQAKTDTETTNATSTATELPIDTARYNIEPHSDSLMMYTFIMAP